MNLAQWFITQTGLIREYKQDLPPNMTYRLKIKNIYLLTLCAIPFLALFVFSNKVSAVSDLNYVVNSENCSSSFFICSASSGQSPNSCDGYHYLKISASGDYSTATNSSAFVTYYKPSQLASGTLLSLAPKFSTTTFTHFGTSPYAIQVVADSGMCSYVTGDNFVTFSLSETSPFTCPECEDCDTPAIVAFFRDIFLNTVTGVIPAFAIFVVVWFMVDLLSSLWFGRGK